MAVIGTGTGETIGDGAMGPIGEPTSRRGLSDAEVSIRRERYGTNTMPSRPPIGLPRRVGSQLRDPTILLLIAAATLALTLRDLRDVAVIVVVVMVNTVIGVGQELRAERALEALRAFAEPMTRAWRNGVLTDTPAADLVPGDRVELDAGDIVPADAILLEAAGLEVDESALTGESQPVAKSAGTTPEAQILAGTVVTRGRGTATVTATGPRSAMGKVAALLGRESVRPTPLQRRLRGLGRLLAVAAVGMSAVVLALGLLRDQPLTDMVLTAVSLAVAAVPESLPAVVTLSLALGARRMSQRGAIVRRLAAVETLGSVTTFLTDKTGTLTQGRMRVDRVCAGDREYVWIDQPDQPDQPDRPDQCGKHGWRCVGDEDGSQGTEAVRDLRRILTDALLCNDAQLRAPDGEHPDVWAAGEATEVALLIAAAEAGIRVEEVRARLPRVAECPFDSRRKRMTTVHRRDGADDYLVVCKGAPEALLEVPGLVRSRPAGLRRWIDDLTADGFRVLVVAEAVTSRPDAHPAESNLDVVGLLALTDPPRADAAEVVGAITDAGVTVAMVTGDHPATARAIGERLGIRGAVVTGDELDGPELGFDADPGRVPRIFARTRPEQKYDVVARLQAQGGVVAMTGDGVNDAPALQRADIGVAMGRSGTEVAKQAADVILTDDRLGTVLVAIGEGRRIYANIRTFLRYALAGGLAEVLVMLCGPMVGLVVPLLPGQILWINLLTHGLPGVAFGAEPGDPDALRQPPRSPQESVLGQGLWHQILTGGVLVAGAALVAGALTPGDRQEKQTAVFLTLGLAQLGVAVALRRSRGRHHPLGFLDAAVASSLVLQLAAVSLGPLATLLDTRTPRPLTAIAAIVLAMVPGTGILATRLIGRRHRTGRREPRHRWPRRSIAGRDLLLLRSAAAQRTMAGRRHHHGTHR